MRSDGHTETGTRIYFMPNEIRILLAVTKGMGIRRKFVAAQERLEAR